MECTERKRQAVIASDEFLCRLGVKTLLNVIGIECDLFETNNYEELDSLVSNKPEIDFIILSEGILPSPKVESMKDIKTKCYACKTLIIGKQLIPGCVCDEFILNSYDRRMIVEKLQNFFFETEVSPYDDDSGVLSDRETDVLKAVATGSSNKEIADQLFISINTVITHRKNITRKLGIKTISGLTVYALLNHLIQAEEVM